MVTARAVWFYSNHPLSSYFVRSTKEEQWVYLFAVQPKKLKLFLWKSQSIIGNWFEKWLLTTVRFLWLLHSKSHNLQLRHNIRRLNSKQWGWYQSHKSTNIKGKTSRRCQLLFVNAIFKVGPNSTAQSTLAPGDPMCLRSGDLLLCFYRVPHLTPCVLLLAGGYTPLPKGWCQETSRAQQNKKIQAEGRFSADTDTSSGS